MESRKLVRPMERVFAETRLSDQMLARVYQTLLQVAEASTKSANVRQGRPGSVGRSRKPERLATTTGGQS
jgi:hypothetical protein